jgi:UDP-N-acetylglucosamine acyltransferase
MRNAFQLLFADAGTLSERVEDLAARFGEVKPVRDIIDFIRADSSRAICQPGERSKGNGG